MAFIRNAFNKLTKQIGNCETEFRNLDSKQGRNSAMQNSLD